MANRPDRGFGQITSDVLGFAWPLQESNGACDLAGAFKAWESLLGSDNALCNETICNEYAKTTLPRGTRPAGILRPASAIEVSQIVDIASKYGVRLHAISRGKNWGYGDACAPADGQVIVELTRMNRIRQVNVELGYAVIEAGVSQGQMYQYLRDRDLPLLLDITGAGPDASIVGNILQRGFGHTPYGDRFRHTCGLEVVLSDGRLINTGFGQFENAKASRVFPWGLGPWIDGVFTQSNYGIVTSACVWLMPKPALIQAFLFKVSDENLGAVVDAVRRLRMAQTVRSTIHIANDLRVLSSRIQYPWALAEGKTPLPDALRRKLRREHGLSAWNGMGSLYGTRAEVRAAKQIIRREFLGLTRVFFFGRRALGWTQQLGRRLQSFRWARRVSHLADSVESVLDLLEGIPNESHIIGVNWRDKQSAVEKSADPRNSGLIWASPVIPATPHDVQSLLDIAGPIFEGFGFDFLITMSSITERSLCCVMSINYDKSDQLDRKRAAECYEQLMTTLYKFGYIPYRGTSVKLTLEQ